MGFPGVTRSLPLIADGILNSEWYGLILSSADAVQEYAEHGCSTGLSNDDAERVRRCCMGYLGAEDKDANVFFRLVTEPLSAAGEAHAS